MNDSSARPSVFESFNARNLSPQQVAQRFIPPRHFEDLILRRHSLVIGPRGSGKTTLLKMLQLPALAEWSHAKADYYRQSIDFTGIFVAADVSWGAQLDALGLNHISKDAREILGLSAFTSHVLIALVEAMRESASGHAQPRPSMQDKYVSLTKDTEAALCRMISKNWRLAGALPTFNGIKLALRERLSEIAQISRRSVFQSVEALNDEIAESKFLHLDFLECTIFGIEAFNSVANQIDRRWALLFDELEIAPKHIRRSLFAALRSADHRLLFKLSISPYHEDAEILQTSSSAMAGQDYQPIELWYPRKEEGYEFSEALLTSMLEEAGVMGASSEDILGASLFDAGDLDRDGNLSGYRPGTAIHKRFKSLASKDASFREYLDAHRIDIDAMHMLPESERAALVRKGTSVIAVRDNFRTPSAMGGAPTRLERSRKAPILYTGNRSLFAIIEGNPRWFIGIMGPLIRHFRETQKRVPRSLQAKAIMTSTNRFRALLRTIPYSAPSYKQPGSRGLLSMLDLIGETFHSNLVVGDFNPDPPLSFVVDSNATAETIEALGRALNAGAIILAGEQGGDALLSSLKGKRFRLSYMLATGYGLPLTLGRPISLSQLLERTRQTSQQLSLLDGNG